MSQEAIAVVVPSDSRVARREEFGTLSTAQMIARQQKIQEVAAAVMTEGVHYGKIPGTGDRNTLLKPGAEILCSTFGIALRDPIVVDLSTHDEIRYRVTVQGESMVSGVLVGSGIGECSTAEEKYRWKKPACDAEWDATPGDQRREKWAKDGKKWKQIRTNPADLANTVLKMAKKRALVDFCLTALGASDAFSQDVEDLPEEIAAEIAEQVAAETGRPIRMPHRKGEAPTNGHVPAAPTGTAPAGAVYVKQVGSEEKSGSNGDYTIYRIKFSDGTNGDTFSDSIGADARRAHENGNPVRVVLEPASNPRYAAKVKSLHIVEPGA